MSHQFGLENFRTQQYAILHTMIRALTHAAVIALFLYDVKDKFRPVMMHFENIVSKSKQLTSY